MYWYSEGGDRRRGNVCRDNVSKQSDGCQRVPRHTWLTWRKCTGTCEQPARRYRARRRGERVPVHCEPTVSAVSRSKNTQGRAARRRPAWNNDVAIRDEPVVKPRRFRSRLYHDIVRHRQRRCIPRPLAPFIWGSLHFHRLRWEHGSLSFSRLSTPFREGFTG